jgi:hypothetical protein
MADKRGIMVEKTTKRKASELAGTKGALWRDVADGRVASSVV